MDRFAQYTDDQLKAAAKRALAAGDREAARRLFEFAQKRQGAAPEREHSQPNSDGTYGQPPEDMVFDPRRNVWTSRELMANNMQPTRGRAVIDGASQGMSFGSFDEMAGLVGSDFSRERARARLDASRRDHPGISLASEVAGAVAVPIPGGQKLATGGLLARTGKGAVAGGLLGSLYGYFTGEGGLKNRLENARNVGVIGAVTGGAAPGFLDAGRWGINTAAQPVRNVADRLLNRGSEARAGRALSRTLRRSGQSIDELEAALRQAANEGQDVYRLADALGEPGQRQLSGLVRSGGEGADDVARFLQQRQLDQPDRMSRFVTEAFDATETAAQRQARLAAERRAAAGPAYDAARAQAGPVDVSRAVNDIDQVLRSNLSIDGGRTSLRESAVGKRLAAIRAQIADGDNFQAIRFDDILDTKIELNNALQRSGGSSDPRLTRVLRQLDEALEAASDGYRAANDGYRAASQAIDAVDTGINMARPSQRPDDVLNIWQALSPSQQASARVGYGNELLRRIESTGSVGTNRAAPFSRTKAQMEIPEIALNPGLLSRRLNRENTMFSTQARATGGSRTADNLADISSVDDMVMGAGAKLAQGRFVSAIMDTIQSGMKTAFGESPQTRRLVVDALMSGDTSTLRRALEREGVSKAKQEAVEQLIRRSTPALASQ